MSNIVTSGQPLDPQQVSRLAADQAAKYNTPTWDRYEAENAPAPALVEDKNMGRRMMEFAKAHYKKRGRPAQEVAVERFEENRANSRSFQWTGQERWQGRENEEMRLVRIFHPYTFLRKLRAAGIDAREEESKHARVWLNSFSLMGRVGLNAWVKPEDGTPASLADTRIARTLTTLQYPYGPEWSIMRFNEYNVPVNERYRGWRTALLVLITSGVLTEGEANRAFGEPIGDASLFYREQLQCHRALMYGLNRY